VIADEREAAVRVVRMITEKKVRAIGGTNIEIAADSVCIYGDGIHAYEFVKKLRDAFVDAGIEKTAPLADIVL